MSSLRHIYLQRLEIITKLAGYHDSTPLTMSLGMFDGVHKGHQQIIKDLEKYTKSENLTSGILTFWPHPRKVLQQNSDLKLLNTLEEKLELFEKFGIEKVFIQEFNARFRNLTGKEFVKEILLEKMNMRHLIIGYDHHFGKDKSGDFQLLKKMALENDFKVEQTRAVFENELAVSSSKIRTALLGGNIQGANELLGYHYPLSGTVYHGKKIGRTLGFPTANIKTDSVKLLPKNGAYIVDVKVGNEGYHGMLSVGTNPTVNGTEKTVEVYLLNFDRDIYGEKIIVKFRDFLHEEIKFETLEQLLEKLQDDEKRTAEFFNKVKE